MTGPSIDQRIQDATDTYWTAADTWRREDTDESNRLRLQTRQDLADLCYQRETANRATEK